MGMVMGVTALSDDNIERVLADPPLVWQVLAPDDPETLEESLEEAYGTPGRPASRPSLLARLVGRHPTSARRPRPSPLTLKGAEGEGIDVGKAWHGLHYIFTGTAWDGDFPANFIVADGTTVEGIHVGYGAARVLRAAEVKEIARFLRSIDADEARSRFDPADMQAKDIYPSVWGRAPDDDAEYLIEYLEVLREFFDRIAAMSLGAVLSLY